MTKTTQAQREHINKLQSDLKRIDLDRQKLSSEREQAERAGRNVRQFLGDGDRQYLTGLKVGGKRILILVDASASMLDESIVNIIRLRNLPDATRRKTEKWQRTVQTTEWLLSQLPADSEFQVYRFNTDAVPLAGEPGRWLAANQSSNLDAVVAGLNRETPSGGTSLYNAFSVLKNFEKKPDNVILLTDGLPTMGKSGHSGGRVSGKQRMRYFNQAARILPRNIPLNTILFPIEGDPFAASEYWKLAINSAGSFMSPARDWP